jgi:hypothetical protein
MLQRSEEHTSNCVGVEKNSFVYNNDNVCQKLPLSTMFLPSLRPIEKER